MIGKLKLNDLLGLTEEELSRTRVRLNTSNSEKDPIEVFKVDPDDLLYWNYHYNKKYRKGMISIGLVDMGDHRYLLFTVGEVTDDEPVNKTYKFITYDRFRDLYGRVIVYYKNKSQNMFRTAKVLNDLEVVEILPSFYKGFQFQGYDKVYLSYDQLKAIVKGDYPNYRSALEMQKAVYVQTDTATGKLYIGSATAENKMLLARWKNYVDTGHGGNKKLKQLINEKGFDYIKKNFTYAILEVFNSTVDDEYVKRRERYWKKVFDSVNHGYNDNW